MNEKYSPKDVGFGRSEMLLPEPHRSKFDLYTAEPRGQKKRSRPFKNKKSPNSKIRAKY